MDIGIFIIVWLSVASQTVSATPDRDKKYMYFTGNDATHWSDAKENCAKINGRLAKDLILTDWDLRLPSLTPFLNNLYWTRLKKENGEWKWEDGDIIDYNSTQAAPLRPENSANIPYECALWNGKEPFWIPSDCTDIKPYICEFTVSENLCYYTSEPSKSINMTDRNVIRSRSESDLQNEVDKNPHTKINDSLVYIQQTVLTSTECEDSCTKFRGKGTGIFAFLECWLAEYNATSSSSPQCRTVLSVNQPSTIRLNTDNTEVQILSRHCLDVEAFINDTCDCRCINITVPVIPATEEEFQEFVEEKREEAKSELIVETKNLSAVVRKKTSAPDERESSTGMGYFGIAAISLVLGGLVLADVSAMIKDAKLMVSNLKSRFG